MKKFVFAYFVVLISVGVYSQDSTFNYYDTGNKLLIYADEGNLDMVKITVEKYSADVNFQDYYGVSPLMFAAQQGHSSVVLYLIEKNANVNASSTDFKITALISAVKNNYLNTAEILIRNGADINAQDVFGRSALHYAAIYGFDTMADMLLYYETDVDIQDAAGITPLCYSVINNNNSVTMLLSLFDADASIVLNDSSDLFHLAAENGNVDFLNMFKNEIVLRENEYSLNPVEVSIVEGKHETLKWFLDNGFELRDTINGVYTPRTLSKYSKNFKTNRIIRKMKIKDYHYIWFNSIGGSFDLIFNGDDFFMSAGLLLSETRYGFIFETGMLFRSKEKEIILPKNDDVFYQLREDRKGLYLKAIKNFKVFKIDGDAHIDLFVGARATYWWGNYDGLRMKIIKQVAPSPLAGFCFNSGGGFRFTFSTEYLNLPVYGVSPMFYSFGFNATINYRKDEVNKKYKYINKY